MNKIFQTVGVLALLVPNAPGFAMDAAGPPLPAVETVLERLAKQAQKEEANEHGFKQRYHFTRTKTTEIRNGNGEVKKREAKTQLNQPAKPPASEPPLLPAPQSEPTPNPGNPATAAATPTPASGKPVRKSDFALDRDFLQRFQFTLVGRESINGRPALILDLVPAAKTPPEHGLKDRILNRAAGRVWVDEAESVLVQARLHLTEKVNVVGGLVGAIVHFTLSFTRTRTADGFWFTPRLDWHLDGREVLLRRTMDSQEEITGVQLAQ